MGSHLQQTTPPETTGTDVEPFPVRPLGERTLTGAVMAWASAQGVPAPTLRSKQDTFAHALHIGQQHIDVRSQAWRGFAGHVVREYHADVTGEPLGGDTPAGQVRANRYLQRLIASHGALTTLRLIATALEAGAGLGEGHEDDVLAVLKYAAAVGRREASEWGRR